MSKLELQKCVLGMVFTNCYFLKNKETGELLIIDPADAPEKIFQKVEEMQGRPVGILLTHGHYDHILAAEAVKEQYQIKIYACAQEQEMLREPSMNMSGYGGKSTSIKPDVLLHDLEVFTAAGFSIQMLHTPGHTPGSCCYYLKEEGVLFSGDTLFYGSVGRTDFEGGSTADIVRSLHKLVDNLPEETEVFPGHDASTTIGYEKRYNPFV
ncbi:MAG TPA: MBL fold metallo-hydrolase [Candidatus Blautia faecigallinarum]|uniref:MBL fold metallo-hydrolase n=1 Tax=Candidatus Blautia faecigallinarum TaxID=2838488 RepID=A0A9D2ISU6_9FIRM|nr:MBL fold metallo-hydrolase [Candidatus Blautia faecigallinarum]